MSGSDNRNYIIARAHLLSTHPFSRSRLDEPLHRSAVIDNREQDPTRYGLGKRAAESERNETTRKRSHLGRHLSSKSAATAAAAARPQRLLPKSPAKAYFFFFFLFFLQSVEAG